MNKILRRPTEDEKILYSLKEGWYISNVITEMYPYISLTEKQKAGFSASDWEMKCPPAIELDPT